MRVSVIVKNSCEPQEMVFDSIHGEREKRFNKTL